MHYETNYTENCGVFNCADKGTYGKDTSLGMIKTMLDKAGEESEMFDAVLIQGDFIRHDFNIGKDGVDFDHKIDTIIKMFKNLTDMVEAKFPGTPILPVFGNNDVEKGYQTPNNTKFHDEFYKRVFEAWFPADKNEMKDWDTFKKGGFYSYSIDDSLEVLGLNSLYFAFKNHNEEIYPVADT
jgi:hypothetical protein